MNHQDVRKFPGGSLEFRWLVPSQKVKESEGEDIRAGESDVTKTCMRLYNGHNGGGRFKRAVAFSFRPRNAHVRVVRAMAG